MTFWYRCFYRHRSRDSVSPVWGIFSVMIFIYQYRRLLPSQQHLRGRLIWRTPLWCRPGRCVKIFYVERRCHLRARHNKGGHNGPLWFRGPPGPCLNTPTGHCQLPCQHTGDAGEGRCLTQPHEDPHYHQDVGVASLTAQLRSFRDEQREDRDGSHGGS